jgi:putative (di)nucleoside polyphosphate hydrolase
MTEEKNYRPNVAAIIVSHAYPDKKEIFIAQRNDMYDIWQFPQGGIDEGETPDIALFRELEEEIGTCDASIVAEFPQWISYDFPLHIAEKMAPFAGQKQRYYLVRLNESAVVNLQTKHPEFKEYCFVQLDELFARVAHFKKPIYEQVIEYFKEQGYL